MKISNFKEHHTVLMFLVLDYWALMSGLPFPRLDLVIVNSNDGQEASSAKVIIT